LNTPPVGRQINSEAEVVGADWARRAYQQPCSRHEPLASLRR
jgi:hypothetical protein